MKRSLALFTCAQALALAACQPPGAEFQRALPDRDLVVKVPGETTAAGLGAQTTGRGLVGAPAEWYSNTYYGSRDLNGMVVFVVGLVEAITDLPATAVTERSAVWGPFSDRGEPNEWILEVERRDAPNTHYVWRIAGRPKSATDYTDVVGGAFEPAGDEHGRGWFGIDFDRIKALNPSENGEGQLAFAFEKNEQGVAVLAHARVGALEAGYAYGEAVSGEGFILFALPEDIDHGKDGKVARENVLIRTRWNSDREGRADILATGGDLGQSVVIGSQCWDSVFVSTYEALWLNGLSLAQDGDAAGCAFAQEETPDPAAVPGAGELQSPYPTEMGE